jgi:hypothetical protein
MMLACLSSCESDVPIPPLPEAKTKLVLFSLITPEMQGIQVSVTKTIPIQVGGNPTLSNVIPNATVLFSDLQDATLIPFDPVLQVYALPNYTVQPGKMYFLFVTTPAGLSAKAQCYVPDKLNQSLAITIDSASASPGATSKSYVVQLDWQDMPGSGDYYKTDAIFTTKSTQFPSSSSVHAINMLDVPLARDYLADGRKWQRRSEILPTEDLANYGDKPDSVYAYLLTTDQPYYEFHNSLYKYRNSATGLSNFTDPVSVYTNVEGGFGVFAAYRSYKAGVKF